MYKVFCLRKNYFPTVLSLLISAGSLLGLNSCDNADKKEITFFGGKIKNPKHTYVYLSQQRKVIDSARLDDHDKFAFELDSLKEGLYTFKHGPEFQYLYLEPADSVQLYLNTWDFDESIVFSGKGSAKNNFLINMFLQQEKTEKNFKPNNKLDQDEFSQLIDEEIENKLALYEDFVEGQDRPPTERFDKLAKTLVYYPLYYLKEYYPFNHMGMLQLKDFPEMKDDFYAYRAELDLNDPDLIDLDWYYAYIRTYLYHLSYKKKYLDHNDNNIELNFMKEVNEKISLPMIKDKLLATSAWRSLSNEGMTAEQNSEVLDYFFAHCGDEKIKQDLKVSLEQKEKLKKGERLPNLLVVDSKGEKVMINNLARNNTSVIYFWPTDLMRVEMVNEKLEKLQKEYPDVTFIGIDRSKDPEEWKKFIASKKLPAENQFRISKDSECYSWFEGDMDRSILVNKKGQVENSYLFLTDNYFAMHLEDLKKR